MILFLLPHEPNDYVYLLGNTCIALIGLLLFRITTDHWWCRYGREALLCAASFITIIAVLRLAVAPFEAITLPNAAIINSFSALAFLTIMLGVVFLHRTKHGVGGSDRITGGKL